MLHDRSSSRCSKVPVPNFGIEQSSGFKHVIEHQGSEPQPTELIADLSCLRCSALAARAFRRNSALTVQTYVEAMCITCHGPMGDKGRDRSVRLAAGPVFYRWARSLFVRSEFCPARLLQTSEEPVLGRICS